MNNYGNFSCDKASLSDDDTLGDGTSSTAATTPASATFARQFSYRNTRRGPSAEDHQAAREFEARTSKRVEKTPWVYMPGPSSASLAKNRNTGAQQQDKDRRFFDEVDSADYPSRDQASTVRTASVGKRPTQLKIPVRKLV
jgi:hypothetical protein